MGAKIRAIIKRPDEMWGHMTNISPSLENLQRTVGGYIEPVQLRDDVVILCDEEGKLKDWEPNIPHPHNKHDLLVGTIIVLGVEGEEFTDLPAAFEFSTWKEILKKLRKGESV